MYGLHFVSTLDSFLTTHSKWIQKIQLYIHWTIYHRVAIVTVLPDEKCPFVVAIWRVKCVVTTFISLLAGSENLLRTLKRHSSGLWNEQLFSPPKCHCGAGKDLLRHKKMCVWRGDLHKQCAVIRRKSYRNMTMIIVVWFKKTAPESLASFRTLAI